MTTATQIEQPMEALKVANDIRSHRAQIKRDLHAGRQKILPLFLDPPAAIANAYVSELLRSLRGFGRTRADKTLADARVSPTRRVANLTERERGALILRLRKHGVR